MQVFDISIGINGSRIIDVRADYIYFLNGSAGGGDTTISFQPQSGGETVYLKPGQAYKLPPSGTIETRWILKNLKGEGVIVGQVLMGEGEFSDNRVSGSVEVIDGGKSRSMAGLSFLGYQNPASVVGEYGIVQLFNPLASTKNVFVSRVTFSSVAPAPNSPRLMFHNTAFVASTQKALSKKNGGALSSADINTGSAVGFPGSALFATYIDPNNAGVVDMKEPIFLPPGTGLHVAAGVVNSAIPTTFDFYEEPI